MPGYDVVVVGLGAMGSASLHSLAKRGQRVLGIERYEPAHDRSSSFGESRLIRLAYAEGPEYVPLLRAAYRLWHDLEEATGETVMIETGLIEAGYPGSAHVAKSLLSCAEQDVKPRHLTAAAANAEYPAFNIPNGWDVIFQQEAGALLPEKAIRLFVARARSFGAQIRLKTRVVAIEPVGEMVHVVLESGERIEAGSVVVAAGAWIGDLLPEVVMLQQLELTRQPLIWFQPTQPALVGPDRMPAFIIEAAPEGFFYGLPDICGLGVKVALHTSGGGLSSAEQTRAEVSAAEIDKLHEMIRRFVPAAAGPHIKSTRCIYTRAPESRFVVGLHPSFAQIVIASACSGHGFKFASVMGEVLADLAIQRATDYPTESFRPRTPEGDL